jgi:integrase
MHLIADCEAMIAARSICVGTQNQYRRAVRCYSEWLQHAAERGDLLENRVNQWLCSMVSRASPETIRGRKAGITAVWNWLSGQHLVPAYNPNLLRRIDLRWQPPRAWAVDDVRILLVAADKVQGHLASGVRAADLLTAWIWLGYESGLRPSDIQRLQVNQLGECIAICQHKTGQPHTFRLSPAAVHAISAVTQVGRSTVFGLPRSTMRRWELKLFAEAEKIGFRRLPGQGLGTLRKTHGTEVCRHSGLSAAAISLGHVSGTLVAKRSYVQPDALAPPPAPPRLDHAKPNPD